MNEHWCPIACNPCKGDRECFYLEKNFHAHCLTCPSNGREQSLPSRALPVFDETNKMEHVFSRALVDLKKISFLSLFSLHLTRIAWLVSRCAIARYTYIFVSRALLDLLHDARLRDTYISVLRALLVKMKKTLKKERKQRDNRVVLSFPSFYLCFPHLTRIAWLALRCAIHVFFFHAHCFWKWKRLWKKKKKENNASNASFFLLIYFSTTKFSPFYLYASCGASSNRQDESPSQGLSLNRSQRGNCSTEYNTPPGT